MSKVNGEQGGPEHDPKPKLVAFGRFVKPEMYDVFGDYNLESVTEAEADWMQTNNISPMLFEPKETDVSLIVDKIAVNAAEYGMLARNPEKLGQSAIAYVLGDEDVDQTRINASRRGRIHWLEGRFETMTDHLPGLLKARQDVKDLRKEAQTPGYAHKTEEWMKEHLGIAWLEFKTVLDVIHNQRDWDEEKRSRAEAALIRHLTQGSQNERVQHWQEWIDLANNYLGARVSLFKNRIRQVRQRLPQQTADETTKSA